MKNKTFDPNKPQPNTWNKDFRGYPISAVNVCYNGEELPESGITPGDSLVTALGKLDETLQPISLTEDFLNTLSTNPAVLTQFCIALADCFTTTSTSTSTTTSTTTVFVPPLEILEILTTDPDNLPGDNGTATITFINGIGDVSYTLDGVPQGVTTSPILLTGLLANTSYTIVLTDSLGNIASATFTLGESTFTFIADYMMLTYEFIDGDDLDTRTRIVTPDVGQDVQNDYIGWACQSQWPIGDPAPYLIWGGDNTGTGFESVLVNLNQFSVVYPFTSQIVMDLRAFWYDTVGVQPVNVAATLWKGGIPVKVGFVWTNPTADATFTISSVGTVITSDGLPTKSLSSGQRVATLTYDLVTGVGVLNNNDTITPSV